MCWEVCADSVLGRAVGTRLPPRRQSDLEWTASGYVNESQPRPAKQVHSGHPQHKRQSTASQLSTNLIRWAHMGAYR